LENRRLECYVPAHQVAMAATILQVNGIDAALQFVQGMPQSKPSIQAAFEFYLEEMG